MLKEFNALKKKMFRVMDDSGKIILPRFMPDLDEDTIVGAYKKMLFARTVDLMIVNYQRQGRIYTYPPNYGQEAISAATVLAKRDTDWVVPAFREMGLWLAHGATLKELFLYFMGYENGSRFVNAPRLLPISVPIASQYPHAAGLAYSIKYKKLDEVVYAIVGDGGTSEGDFHEALNFAAVWKVPVVFIVQNNQYAISVPFSKQTASEGIAIKAVAYGMPGIQVDGNDFFALTQTMREATDHVRSGNGPILIEAVTYRKGSHTTSDDPTKYRTKDEEEMWDKKDPLTRLKSYLLGKKFFSEEEEEGLVEEYKKEIDRIFQEAEAEPDYPLEDVFSSMYVEMPDDLKRQRMEHERFLQWKESRKN